MGNTSLIPNSYLMVAITAGTGGPNALMEVLGGLSRDVPYSIFIMQSSDQAHFLAFVAWLAENCPLPILVAEDGLLPQPGMVYMAPPVGRIQIQQGRIEILPDSPEYKPRDPFLRSMARELGPRAVAVALTGMGIDGAQGMKEVRDAGGYTIAQDAATSLIDGTSREAVRLNAGPARTFMTIW